MTPILAPERYVRTPFGTYAELVPTALIRNGQRAYHLRFGSGQLSCDTWTRNELLEQRVRWLKTKPRALRQPR